MIDVTKDLETVGPTGAVFSATLEGVSRKGAIIVRSYADLFLFDQFGQDLEGDFRLRNKAAKRTYEYVNAYADGTSGTAHETWEEAREYHKYGKVRVGILKRTYEDGKLVYARMIATEATGRDADRPNGFVAFPDGEGM